MANIKLGENQISTVADLPEIGSKAPDFKLTKTDFKDVSIASFSGKKILLNIFPSIQTGVCSASVRRFNQEAASLENTAVLCISTDLPFAHQSFCAAEGIDDVTSLSALRTRSFGKDYGVMIADGAWEGLFSRAVVVVDESGDVVYTEQVPAIGQEPDYDKALQALK